MRGCLNVKKVKGTEEKKKVKGWSTEEVKDKPREDREKDTEEKMIKWRSMSQEEMYECWKGLAEKMEEEVLDKNKMEDSKRGAYRGRGSSLEWREDTNVARRLLGKNLSLCSRNTACSVCKACMRIRQKEER